MSLTSRHCGTPVILVGVILVGVVWYSLVYKAGVSTIQSYSKNKLSPLLRRIDKVNTGMLSDKQLSRLEKKKVFLEEKLKELEKKMGASSKKAEAHLEILTGDKKVMQQYLDQLLKQSAKKEKELEARKEELEAEVRTLKAQKGETSSRNDGSEVAADEDLDPGTLKWKKLLFTPRNASFIENRTKVDDHSLALFYKYALSQTNKDFVFKAFDIWLEIATEEKIPYFISQGSLLGSYRHHGLIPWDGDIDVVMDEKYKEIFLQAFERKNYTNWVINQWRPWAKIHPKNGTKPSKHYPWRTPFVDVFYWKQNATHLWGKGHHPKLKTDVFPLQKRPFQGRMVFGPRDPHMILSYAFARNTTFGPTGEFIAEHICKGGDYDYIKERFIPNVYIPRVPCSQLLHIFPFVRHIRGEGGAYCKEELIMKGKVISVFYRNATGIPVC